MVQVVQVVQKVWRLHAARGQRPWTKNRFAATRGSRRNYNLQPIQPQLTKTARDNRYYAWLSVGGKLCRLYYMAKVVKVVKVA